MNPLPIPIQLAKNYLLAGLCALPALAAEKRPALPSWRDYQKRLPTEPQVNAWFSQEREALCIVAGAVSGNLECLDFDAGGECFEPWTEAVPPELFGRLVVERTPSGGVHVVYRCTEAVEGNLKLAEGERNGKRATLIETRGEGGLFLCSPSPGYHLIQGAFGSVPTISAEDRRVLLDAARALSEISGTSPSESPAHATPAPSPSFIERPGDAFNRDEVAFSSLLERHGWQFLGKSGDNEQWRRPGKDSGSLSATFNGVNFHVFSSNADPFPPGFNGSPFIVYALLEHGGDKTAAAKELLAEGYGSALDPCAGVDLSGLLSKNDPGKPEPGTPDFLWLDELVEQHPNLPPPVIHGLLRVGETMNVIAPPKTGKSWLVNELAACVATGTPWYGFDCTQGNVLVIDNELFAECSADRIPKVVRAKAEASPRDAERFSMQYLSRRIAVDNQRGRLDSIDALGRRIERFKAGNFRLVIIDAFYRALPIGLDENDNGGVAQLYNRIDRYARELGAAFVLIHHTSKGNQSLKSVTDVGSGAGAQSRAADTHLVLRRHREEDCVVMEAAVRSFPPVSPVCLRWSFPLWRRDDTLDPADLEGKAESREEREEARRIAFEQVVDGIPGLVNREALLSREDFTRDVQDRFDISRSIARNAVERALTDGRIELRVENSSGGRPRRFVAIPEGASHAE